MKKPPLTFPEEYPLTFDIMKKSFDEYTHKKNTSFNYPEYGVVSSKQWEELSSLLLGNIHDPEIISYRGVPIIKRDD